jgi:hypothetical protein
MAHIGLVKTSGHSCEYGWIFPCPGDEPKHFPLWVHVKQCNGVLDKLSFGDKIAYDTKWNHKKEKYEVYNCTIVGVTGTTLIDWWRDERFANDRRQWREMGSKDQKWKHDKWESLYKNSRKHDDDNDDDNEDNVSKRARLDNSYCTLGVGTETAIPPRYTAPVITIMVAVTMVVQATTSMLTLKVQASTTIAKVKNEIAERTETHIKKLRLSCNIGRFRYEHLEDKRALHFYEIGDGDTIECYVDSPLSHLLELLDVNAP